ncbi:uncharacterized protein B0I36DRAFT_361043 [Microdochium trichocladiopsis]|uniref:Uncharacterized protein n=1 Tax=Microdochium trichocladiopsis TaxID=1682393 RepID=A0A9P8YD18_9PEZI|nr:uncharacterized protein B0I36DRAFT_361043 [Microdochium trichocladiopsis]KAH7035710.1 hypothetical protein B0I36DRAFT_361043 [Microdochium trichocladiopsis]
MAEETAGEAQTMRINTKSKAKVEAKTQAQTCIYVPRLCADPHCGALALEVSVHRPCAGGTLGATATATATRASSATRSGKGRRSGTSAGKRCSGGCIHHGHGRGGRQQQQQQHGQTCHDALMCTLRRKDRLEHPSSSSTSSSSSSPRRGGGGGGGPRMMTPEYSTRLINASLPGPLASFSSPLFPCAAVGVKKWERHGLGQMGGGGGGSGGTRFGDAQGRACRGFGTVWWEFHGGEEGGDDDDDGGALGRGIAFKGEEEQQEEEVASDDAEDEVGIDKDQDKHEDKGTTRKTANQHPMTKSGKTTGHFLRRSNCANSGGPEGLLFCAEHLHRQYPDLSGKELQRIKEVWGALSQTRPQGEYDAVYQASKFTGPVEGRATGQARESEKWRCRIGAKQPQYWTALMGRGLAL